MRTIAITGLVALGLLGCTQAEMPQPEDGKRLFDAHCAACHGAMGQGDGAAGAALDPRPADLTRLRTSDGLFPRAQVLSVIDGYTRGEGAHPGMPAFGDSLGGDLVPFDSGDGVMTPTPRLLVALVGYLETLQRPGEQP